VGVVGVVGPGCPVPGWVGVVGVVGVVVLPGNSVLYPVYKLPTAEIPPETSLAIALSFVALVSALKYFP
jgi:hypothetical protein